MAKRISEPGRRRRPTRVRRSGGSVQIDGHLAAIHHLLEESRADQERVGMLSQLFATVALMVGAAIYLVSRSQLVRAAKDGHGHIILEPPTPEVTTIILMSLALLTGVVVLARSFQGVAAGLILFLIPLAISASVGLSSLGGGVDPPTVLLECLLGLGVCVEYITLHRKGLDYPAVLPVSLLTTAAIQVPIAVLTAGASALLVFLDVVLIPDRYRGQPALVALATVTAVAAPTVAAVFESSYCDRLPFPRPIHRPNAA